MGFLVVHLELPWPEETRQNWSQLDKFIAHQLHDCYLFYKQQVI